LVFNNRFFNLSRFFSKDKFQPFNDNIFWKIIEDPFSLFYTHSKDYFTFGIRTFKIVVIPQNIHANMKQFIQSLNSSLIPFSFQVIQKPIPNMREFSFETQLIFNIYYSVNGRLNYSRLRELILTHRCHHIRACKWHFFFDKA
jgi:hypothetical protein